jgi:hypothetical protein
MDEADMSMISPGPDRHECVLPPTRNLQPKTLIQCHTCKSWWIVFEQYIGFGFSKEWYPVRWYNFVTRRRIKRSRP